MIKRALTNAILSAVIVSLAGFAAAYFPTPIADILRELTHAVFICLLVLTTQVAYKVHDIGHVKSLSELQIERLKTIARWKSVRLWMLVAGFGITTVLIVAGKGLIFDRALTFLALVCIFTFAAFVPRMWMEIQEFNLAARRLEEEAEKRRGYLADWEKKSQPGP